MDDFEDKIFNNDPIYMRSLVGKKVELETVENVTHSGIVYVIDPIYKTVVLHSKLQSEVGNETIFVLYHAIKSLKVLSDEIEESYINKFEETQCSSDNGEKKNVLKKMAATYVY
ncbi:hypothetical protein NQ314_017606 [Rhamnusium bicolor]|uniref:Uncharacterized protein n=1 Tax=Rhamnusium bicolor TaxID=1586634 RepID=A0AAV8WSF2_9CUCU|nr:hypothetical protein NQ314_017606 [Rhamnusium bicolor]